MVSSQLSVVLSLLVVGVQCSGAFMQFLLGGPRHYHMVMYVTESRSSGRNSIMFLPDDARGHCVGF